MHDDDYDGSSGPFHPIAIFICALMWACGIIIAVWLMVGQAWAHDAIASRQQPLGWAYDYSCCNLMDCREVADAAVKTTRAGYVIVATGEVIPFNDPRIKRSKDEFFHWCSKGGREDSETICLYKPDAGF